MKIKIVKKVTFTDLNGKVLKVYNPGDIIESTGLAGQYKDYFNTGNGA